MRDEFDEVLLGTRSPIQTPEDDHIQLQIEIEDDRERHIKSGAYDFQKIRNLLDDITNKDDLRNFCLYEAGFQPVYNELKDSDRKTDILRRLINYARQKGLVARLLDWARETNAARYAAGEPYEG